MKLENISTFGIEDAVKASKYPMSVDTAKCSTDITDTVKKLGSSKIGHGHDQFLTGCVVQFDLTFTLKAWTEAERYRFFYFVSSCSTMHRIARFNIRKQCNEYVDNEIVNILQKKIDEYNKNKTDENYLKILYNIPSGFELTARMVTNYRQLKTIYYQRKSHRLPEWREFCKEIENLPYFKELVLGGEQ